MDPIGANVIRFCAVLGLLALAAPPALAAPALYANEVLVFERVDETDLRRYRRGVQQHLKRGRLKSIRAVGLETGDIVIDKRKQRGLADLPLHALVAVWGVPCRQRAGFEFDAAVQVRGAGYLPVSVTCEGPRAVVVEWGTEPLSVPRFEGSFEEAFGVGPFLDGEKDWTDWERDAGAQALGLLSDEELALIAGLPFVRNVSQSEGIAKSHAAYFSLDGNGDAAIVVLDQAFEHGYAVFSGDPGAPLPRASTVYLHEVGHAIARASLRELLAENDELYAETDAAFDDARVVYDRYAAAGQAVRARVDAYNARVKEYDALVRRYERKKATREEVEALAAELSAEAAAIDADKAAFRELEARYLELKPELESMSDASTDAAAEAEALLKRSPLLAAFAELPGAKKGPTPYGRTTMDESFAEAFALFKVDPDALRRISPEMVAWFVAGEHLLHVE